MTGKKLEKISASPVKSFFVQMLTRDIELRDAILDLLDNSVDGVQRSETKQNLERAEPYSGYWAKITLSKDEFRIEDNCGGIPWKFHEYAFRMGREKNDVIAGKRMIGTVGIGMKRAIFKLGEDCTIETHAKDCSYRIHISPEWMANNENWDLIPEEIKAKRQHGTSIRISKLRDGVKNAFIDTTFGQNFSKAIAAHYAYIMGKGFQVYLNEEIIKPNPIRLLFSLPEDSVVSEHAIRPFMFKATHNAVDIFLAVGFAEGKTIPSKEEADASFENFREKYSSADAGWTVICNDRTVLYCDKSPLTGWGVSGVPQFHMQFNAISGIVVFSSDDARLLPITTTKRGIDAQSELYLHVKDKMVEGMKLFTNYTNDWKGKELVGKSRESFAQTSKATVNELVMQTKQLNMSSTRGTLKGLQYRPRLPKPPTSNEKIRISFSRPEKEVRILSKYLFDTPDEKASEIGEECFRLILEEASQ
jgi:hypothetical protein